MATLVEQIQALPKNPRGFVKDKEKHASLQNQLDTLSGQLKKLQYVKPTGTKKRTDLHKKDKSEKKVEKKEKKVEKKEKKVETKKRTTLHKKPKVVKQEKKVEKKEPKVVLTSKKKDDKKEETIAESMVRKWEPKKKVVKKEPKVVNKVVPTPKTKPSKPIKGRDVDALEGPETGSSARKTFAPPVKQEGLPAPSSSAIKSSDVYALEGPETGSSARPQDRQSGASRTARTVEKNDPITERVEKLLGLNRSPAQIRKDMQVTEDLEKELGFSGGQKRGGRITRKKYAMNRGGKVASIRKPTRA